MQSEKAEKVLTSTQAVLSGWVEHEQREVGVTLCAASRLSFGVSFLKHLDMPNDTVFPKLQVRHATGTFELTRCKFVRDEVQRGFSGRLVFLDDLYDVEALFTEGKVVNLKAFFQKLPMVLEKRQEIRPAFRAYVADAMYDLAVYKKFFDEQDRALAGEPPAIIAAAHEALRRDEGRRFMSAFDAQLEALEELVADFDKQEHERHGFYLRKQAWDFILASEFLKRTNLKPRGYAGDSEMMQMCYENKYVGRYLFNQLMHKHPVESPAAQAVRNRRSLIPRILREVRSRYGRPAAGTRFMSVACGPACELSDLYGAGDDFEALHCTLLDQDPHALSAARAGVRDLERQQGRLVRVEYLNQSVRTILRTPRLSQTLGRYHFIYSMGLFDYLTPPVAQAVLAKLYELLEPGGCLLVGNYHVDSPTRHYMAYWMDWVLYYRTEEEFLSLASGLPHATPQILFDETRSQMFLKLDKGA